MLVVRAEKGILAKAMDKRYYCPERLAYMAKAGFEACRLELEHKIDSVLELGPYQVPLVEGCDVMDRQRHGYFHSDLYIHDAKRTPWPITTKRYDLFIALQVFEHLQPHAPEAFQEVCRIARHAIISLPIDWARGDKLHRGISEAQALEWFAPVRPSRVVEGNGGKHKRLIFVFENLPEGL